MDPHQKDPYQYKYQSLDNETNASQKQVRQNSSSQFQKQDKKVLNAY